MRRNHKFLIRDTHCEQRLLLAADVFEPSSDPALGTNITTFANESELTGGSRIGDAWSDAIEEAAEIGLSGINLAVVRYVDEQGNFSGGPSLASIEEAVKTATENGMETSIFPFPVIGNGGWRGLYAPTGAELANFRAGYTELVSDLASIPGIDRLNVFSELDEMIKNPSSIAFFEDLIAVAEDELSDSNNLDAEIGFAATFESLITSEDDLSSIAQLDGIDFVGVSTYSSLLDGDEADLVAGTGDIDEAVRGKLEDRWEEYLDAISKFGSDNNVDVLVQEMGAPALNYAALAPHSPDPAGFIGGNLADPDAIDTVEQVAVYESFLAALDGRGDEFEAVNFWTFQNDFSVNPRTSPLTKYPEKFALFPDDGAAGEYIADFLSTAGGGTVTASSSANNEAEEGYVGVRALLEPIDLNDIGQRFREFNAS